MPKYYGFAYHPRCLEYLQGLTKKVRRQIIKRVDMLAADPFPAGAIQVHGLDGVHRIKTGDYRVLYTVREPIVIVLDIGDRKDVYRSMPQIKDEEMVMPSEEFDRIMRGAFQAPAPKAAEPARERYAAKEPAAAAGGKQAAKRAKKSK